jgi:tripartite ATP-independent transporter DctM subunit
MTTSNQTPVSAGDELLAAALAGEPERKRDQEPGPFYRRLLTLDRFAILALRLLLGLVMLAELILVLVNVADREIFGNTISWELTASEVGLLAIGLLGAAVAFCNDEQITIDYVTRRLSQTARARVARTGDWLAIGLTVQICVWTLESYKQATLQEIPDVNISGGVFALILAVAMAIIAVNRLIRIWESELRDVLVGLGVTVVIAIVIEVASQLSFMTTSQDNAIILATVVAAGAIITGVPLTVGFLLFLVSFTVAGYNVVGFVPLGLETGLWENELLLAIPFFVLAGFLLTEGGLARAIVDLLARPLQRVPGGKLQLTVATMFLFSGMTGVKIADVTAVGTAMTDTLVEDGFDRAEIACVLASTASAGEAVPPSIALLILGSVTTLSIGTLFIAGILPALLVMICVSVLIAVRDRRQGRTTAGALAAGVTQAGGSGADTARRIGRGSLAIGLPVILLAGIESGVFTATEASAVAVLYAVIITTVLSPRLSPRQLWGVLERSAAMAGLLLLIVTAASTIGQVLAEVELPQRLATVLISAGHSKWIFLLIVVAVVPIIGALLEGAPAILIFGPLFVPAADALGVNLVQFGIVFILALAVGTFSPLFGIGFYTACRVTRATVSDATRKYAPYFGVMVVGILLVAFIPAISLALPRLFNLAGA